MTEPDLSSYSAEELFKIMAVKLKMGALDGALRGYTLYGRCGTRGVHATTTLSNVVNELGRYSDKAGLHVVVVYSPKETNRNGDRDVIYRSSPEAKAWWE